MSTALFIAAAEIDHRQGPGSGPGPGLDPEQDRSIQEQELGHQLWIKARKLRDTNTSEALVESVNLLNQGVTFGNVHCMNSLGARYNEGIGVKHDDIKALYWFEQAIKHCDSFNKSITSKSDIDNSSGDDIKRSMIFNISLAYFNTGLLYDRRRDYTKAKQFYTRAIDHDNDLNALYMIARLYTSVATSRTIAIDGSETSLVTFDEAMSIISKNYIQLGSRVSEELIIALREHRQKIQESGAATLVRLLLFEYLGKYLLDDLSKIVISYCI